MNRSLIRSFLYCLAAFALPLPSAFAQFTERVSVDSSGIQGNADSTYPSISADGRFVAFNSYADNLVPGGPDWPNDVFVHDRKNGKVTQVSVDSAGVKGNGNSSHASISADGRFVTFHSFASNLVPGDTNNTSDIFVHDCQTGQTSRVSVDSAGVQGNSVSYNPFISADGRFVCFDSDASNLVPSDTNIMSDILVHDRQTGRTTRVSVDSGGVQGNGQSYHASISADGRFVAFHSFATNLVPGDTNNSYDVFVRDRQTGLTTRVSVDSGGVQGNMGSGSGWNTYGQPSISSDGRFVAFWSYATNLVPGDTNNIIDIFVHDRQTGLTTRVNVDSGGVQAEHDSYQPCISADGRFVAFASQASNLVPGDTNFWVDVFVHDQQTGQTTRVSVSSEGVQGNNHSFDPSFSADGRYVAFDSEACNLVPGDSGRNIWSISDIFVHDRKPITPTLAAQGSCPGLMTFTLDAATPEGGVAFALGAAGAFTLTSSVCSGTILDIANPQLGPVIRASWLGTIERAYQIAPAMCGLTVQAVDIHTCKTSNAVVL